MSLRARAYATCLEIITLHPEKYASQNQLYLMAYFLEYADILLVEARVVAPFLTCLLTAEDQLQKTRDAIVSTSYNPQLTLSSFWNKGTGATTIIQCWYRGTASCSKHGLSIVRIIEVVNVAGFQQEDITLATPTTIDAVMIAAWAEYVAATMDNMSAQL